MKLLASALFIYIFLLPVPEQTLFAANVKEPAKPLVPGIETFQFKSFIADDVRNNISVDVLIYVQGMDAQRGRALFPGSSFSIEMRGVNPPGRVIKIGDLRDISILQWKGRPEKKEAFIFYPEVYVLNLRSGESIKVEKNIPFFNSLSLERSSMVEQYYSYFYDYYRRGSWVNMGVASPVPEAFHPLKGCISGIRLFP